MKTIYVKLKPFKLIVEWLTLLGFWVSVTLNPCPRLNLFIYFIFLKDNTSVKMLTLASIMHTFCTITCYCMYVNDCLLYMHFSSYAALTFHHLFNSKFMHMGNVCISLQLTVLHFILMKDWYAFTYSAVKGLNVKPWLKLALKMSLMILY